MNKERYSFGFLNTVLVASPTFGQAERFSCEFNHYCSYSSDCKSTKLSLEFATDQTTGKSILIGNNGIADVFAQPGDRSTTFLEPLGTGAVQSTTILKTGVAAHSRHTIIGNNLAASEYYGHCEVSE